MELADDEAYYWVCGQYLDWGSLHTPPLIPFFSKLGYGILKNEFGVRFFYFIAHLLTLVMLERITKPKDETLFVVILSSFVIMHIAGFWAVPDIPFLLFTVVLIYAFERYAVKNNFLNGLLLSASLALIVYSKYHGVLVIGSLLAANYRLFKRPSFYLIGLGAILFLLPHLIWLWHHDFVTFTFHLNQRDRKGYHWYYPLLYLLNVVLITGPIIGLLLLPKSLELKPRTAIQKNAKFILIGVLVFFLLLSFRNRIEANWMVVLIIPLIILGYKSAEENLRLKKWIYYSFPISILLALGARLFLTFDILPRDNAQFTKLTEFHANKTRVKIIEDRAGGLPIIFQSNHQLPSKYLFYSKAKKAGNRKPYVALSSQYELLHLEKKYHGKKILLVNEAWTENYDFKLTDKGFLYFKEIDTFCSYSHVEIKNIRSSTKQFKAGTVHDFGFELANFNNIDLACPAAAHTYLCYYFAQGNDYPVREVTKVSILDLKKTNGKVLLPIKLPKNKGNYKLIISFWSQDFIPTEHHKRLPIIVR